MDHPPPRHPRFGPAGRTSRLAPALDSHAFTLIELMVAIAIMGILAAIAGTMLHSSLNAARNITAKHDLFSFSKIQEAYYLQEGCFIGEPGESIRNDGNPSDFSLNIFHPSKGVCITIISGDPESPYIADTHFVMESHHSAGNAVYELDLITKQLTKKHMGR